MSYRDSLPFDDGSLFLTDGGMETVLIFLQGLDLPSFATFPLLEHEDGRDALRTLLRAVPRSRAHARHGLHPRRPTWRANAGLGR